MKFKNNLGNKDIFSQNLSRYMSENNIDRKELSKTLNIAYTTLSDWINGKKYPRIDNIEILANYFNIEKSDLIEPPKKENKLTTDQEQLITHYNNSNTQGKTIILTTAKNISKAYPYLSRDEMISYLKQFQRAAYGDMKSIYDMTDEELEQIYTKYKEDFEDD